MSETEKELEKFISKFSDFVKGYNESIDGKYTIPVETALILMEFEEKLQRLIRRVKGDG